MIPVIRRGESYNTVTHTEIRLTTLVDDLNEKLSHQFHDKLEAL